MNPRIQNVFPKFTAALLRAVVKESLDTLIGSRCRAVRGARNPDRKSVDVLFILKPVGQSGSGSRHTDPIAIRVSPHPAFCRFTVLDGVPDSEGKALGFVKSLACLKGGVIVDVDVSPSDRIVEMEWRVRSHRFYFIAECFGPASNMYLLDAGRMIRAMMRAHASGGRALKPGERYVYPDKPVGESLRNEPPPCISGDDIKKYPRFPVSGWYEATVAYHQIRALMKRAFESLDKRLKKKIADTDKRIRSILSTIEQEPRIAQWQVEGSLILAHLSAVPRGVDQIALPAFESPDVSVMIRLDPKKDARRNAESKFKNASKLKTRIARAKNDLPALTDLSHSLAALAGRLDAVMTSQDAPEKILSDLRAVSRALSELTPSSKKPGAHAGHLSAPRGCRRFISKDGIEILVGKKAEDNDRLTFRIAKGNDYWLHAADRKGAHVVVRFRGDALPQETLLDAATLAVLYSGGKTPAAGEVHVTRVKYVSRAKGAPPGQVNFSQGRRITVRIEQTRLQRLKESR